MANRRFGRSLLARHIDAVLEGRRSSCSTLLPPVDSSSGKTAPCAAVSKPILCAGLAFLVLDPGSASAVTLGELSIDSSLGQPLSASMPIRLRDGESLTEDCVTIFEQSGNDLSNLKNPELKVPTTERPGTYSIHITSRQPLFEPMYEFAVRVNCLGTPLLMKHYVLMLDLPGLPAPLPRHLPGSPAPLPHQTMRKSGEASGPAVSVLAAPVQQPTVASAPAASTESAPASEPAPETARFQVPAELIEPGADYRVSSGDSLSSIAARVKGRPSGSVWDVAGWIYAANPNAFVGANPDLIKLGSMIRIPAPGYWETDTIPAADRELAIAPEPETGAAPLPAPTDAIAPGLYYRVSTGDCLSNIAERVEGRPSGSVWDVADWIYAANPDAFVDANPDLIKLGSMIRIPAPGYWETDTNRAADRKSAAASAAIEAAAVRPETSNDEASKVETPAPAPVQTITAEEIDYGVSGSLLPDANQSLTDLAATPIPQREPETEFIEDFALGADSSLGNEESVLADQGNDSALAAPNSATDDTAAAVDTADQIAALQRQLAEARELVEATRRTALMNQAIEATQSVSASSPEANIRRISPLLAICLGLLFGLMLSSLLLRNRLSEFFEWLRRRWTAAREDTAVDLQAEPQHVDMARLDEPPAAYESSPSDTAAFDVALALSGEPPVPSQETLDEALVDTWTPDTPDQLGLDDPDPTGTMNNLFGVDAVDLELDATSETASAMEITHALTIKGLAGLDTTPETASDMEVTHKLSTEELPELDAAPETASNMEVTQQHTIEELSELVDPEDDDILSATLSEALGLLEQDYEDEFAASQIIEKPQLDPSFLDDDDETLIAPERTKEKEGS